MHWTYRVLSCCVALLWVVGCKDARKEFVGTWHSLKDNASVTYHFKPDGKFSMEADNSGCHVTLSGTYELTAGRIIMTSEQSNVFGPEPQATQLRSIASQQARLPYRIDSPMAITLTPNSPDSLQLQRTGDKP